MVVFFFVSLTLNMMIKASTEPISLIPLASAIPKKVIKIIITAVFKAIL